MKKLGMKVVLGADTSQYRRAMKRSSGLVKNFQNQVKRLGGMIAGAFAVSSVISFAKTSAEAYNKQAQAETSLLTALKGRIGAQQELIQLAQQLQRKTLFGDEETIQAEALIGAFVKEKEQIKAIIPLVQDLATAKRMDLAGAADLVSKTLGSSTNALSRYGIQVEGAVGSVERLQSLMKGLNDAFGGQAEAAAKAGTGAYKQLSNAIGDLKENFGSLSTEMNGPITKLTTFIYTVNDFLQSGGFKDFWKGLMNPPAWLKGAGMIIPNMKTILAWNQLLLQGYGKAGNALGIGTSGWEGGAGSLNLPASPMQTRGMAPLATSFSPHLMALDRYRQLAARNMSVMQQAGTITAGVPQSNDYGLANMAPAIQKNFDVMKQIAAKNSVELGGIIQDGIMDAIDQISYGFAQLISGQYGMEGFFNGLLSMFGSFISKMGKMIMAYGVGMISFKQAFSNPVAAISAGAALIAIGAAIAGAARSGPSMAGGGGYYGGTVTSYKTGYAAEQQKIVVEGMIRGEDIYIVNKRQSTRYNRISG